MKVCGCGCGKTGRTWARGHHPTNREPKLPLELRFWSRVDMSSRDGVCWPWLGHRQRGTRPYGMFCVRGPHHPMGPRVTTAHRVALELTLDRLLLPDEYACHRCDNPPCCNPAHLFAGTASENQLDASMKGRRPRGEAHPFAKLSDAQVTEIRDLRATGVRLRILAARFHVAESCISRIANRVRRAA